MIPSHLREKLEEIGPQSDGTTCSSTRVQGYREGFNACYELLLKSEKEVPLPGSFENYWTHRNSIKIPFNHPERSQEDRHMLTWFHAITAWNAHSKNIMAEKDAENAALKEKLDLTHRILKLMHKVIHLAEKMPDVEQYKTVAILEYEVDMALSLLDGEHQKRVEVGE